MLRRSVQDFKGMARGLAQMGATNTKVDINGFARDLEVSSRVEKMSSHVEEVSHGRGTTGCAPAVIPPEANFLFRDAYRSY